MQNSQEINWLAILAPSLITGLFMIGIQILIAYKLWGKMKDYENSLSTDLKSYESSLSRRLEDYKKDISKEIENHKIELQSDFQTRFYQFQTKFSWFYQRKAESIESLYGLIVETNILLNRCYSPVTMKESKISINFEQKRNLLDKAEEKLRELILFFNKNEIYFGEQIRNKTTRLFREFLDLYNRIENSEYYTNITGKNEDTLIRENIDSVYDKIPSLMNELEVELKKIFFVDDSHNQIEKKQ